MVLLPSTYKESLKDTIKTLYHINLMPLKPVSAKEQSIGEVKWQKSCLVVVGIFLLIAKITKKVRLHPKFQPFYSCSASAVKKCDH